MELVVQMKDLGLLVWLTQLGLSVALPPAGMIFLATWLRERFSLGNWIIWVAIVLGLISAVDGLRVSLKSLERLTQSKNEEKDEPPSVSFNEHE